jgi:predicted RNase H-like nuclease
LHGPAKNRSGIAIIDGNGKNGSLIVANTVLTDEEILDFVSKNVKDEPALIAIDAPLIVPNKKGRRLAEQLVGDLFRRYDAGAHPSNRERLGAWSNGKIRGEEITKSLQKLGFMHDPYVKKT